MANAALRHMADAAKHGEEVLSEKRKGQNAKIHGRNIPGGTEAEMKQT